MVTINHLGSSEYIDETFEDINDNFDALNTGKQDQSAILDATTASYTTAKDTKVGYISITQPVDLDALETAVSALDQATILKGVWDASSGVFPGSGVAQAGWSYIVSVAGTVDGTSFSVNDRIIAILDNASTTTFANNWFKADYTDQVLSVHGRTGAVTAQSGDYTTDQITEGTAKFFTDERAQDAVGGILTDTDDIDFTYDDSGAQVTATLKTTSISAKTSKAPVTGGEEIMINDGGTLKKITLADILSYISSSAPDLLTTKSYFHEDFWGDILTATNADNQSIGDHLDWYFDQSGAGPTIEQTDALGGIAKGTFSAVSRGFAMNHGSTLNNLNYAFKASSFPTVQVKFRLDTANSANQDVLIGLHNQATALTTSGALPSDGIYIYKTGAASNWTGVVRASGADVGTISLGAINVDKLAIFRAVVEDATTVRFYMAADLSVSSTLTDYGTVTGTLPTASLGVGALAISTSASVWGLSLDYVTVLQ